MELESYFEFLSDDAIRIAGTRIGIERVVEDYRAGASPEEIALRYPTLTLEQIHATITYYLAHPDHVDAYLQKVQHHQEAAYQQSHQHPSALMRSLRERVARLRQERHATTPVASAKSSSLAFFWMSMSIVPCSVNRAAWIARLRCWRLATPRRRRRKHRIRKFSYG